MGFLPNNFKSAGTSNYMKFKDGANKFRALDDAIAGWEWWTDGQEGKRMPHRVESIRDVPQGYRSGEDRAKQFIAFPVWNYATESVQILQVNQIGIQMYLENIELNPDFGDPRGYDITVTRKGEGLDTEYTVVASPPKENKEVFAEYGKVSIRLEALFEGGDPFEDELNLDIDEIVAK